MRLEEKQCQTKIEKPKKAAARVAEAVSQVAANRTAANKGEPKKAAVKKAVATAAPAAVTANALTWASWYKLAHVLLVLGRACLPLPPPILRLVRAIRN